MRYLDNNPKIKIWDSRVVIEDQALQQARDIASLPIVEQVCLMPDAHMGKGASIGSVIATRKAVIPSAVGVDIGCGVDAIQSSLHRSQLKIDLTALRHTIESLVPHGRSSYRIPDTGSWDERELPSVVLDHTEWVHEHFLKYRSPEFDNIYGWLNRRDPITHLGTLGSGNHFIELSTDEHGFVWILVHSGSRGIGNAIGTFFIKKAQETLLAKKLLDSIPNKSCAYLVEGDEWYHAYMEAVCICQEYAHRSRKAMFDIVIELLRRRVEFATQLEVHRHHNYIDTETHKYKGLFITRKGAIRAEKDDLGVIPGSMGAQTYIVKGLGNEESLHSAAHGAGRLMSRTQAKKTISIEEHARAVHEVNCKLDESILDESPAAYKNIHDVMQSQLDLVSPLYTLKQFLCVKG